MNKQIPTRESEVERERKAEERARERRKLGVKEARRQEGERKPGAKMKGTGNQKEQTKGRDLERQREEERRKGKIEEAIGKRSRG